jgi:uridine kinase
VKGDKLVIEKEHVRAAHQIVELLPPQISSTHGKFIITIAGESGSGKSEIATVISEILTTKDLRVIIFQQDDYFVYPPKTNAAMRRQDLRHVGLSEVRLALLDQNLKDIVEDKNEIVKPLVIFDADRIKEETIKLDDIKVVIVEGTYTTILKNAHQHVFIDRTYIDTRETRQRRARETQDEFLERVLEIEHNIISSQKAQADIVVTTAFEVRKNEAAKKL